VWWVRTRSEKIGFLDEAGDASLDVERDEFIRGWRNE
jgi:hypothetical protein